MKILVIHGIGNYRPSVAPERAASLLAETWTKSLRTASNLEVNGFNFSLSVAYYAHLLRIPGAQSSASDTKLSSSEAQIFLSWAEAYGMPRDRAQGLVTLPIRQIIDWIARKEGSTIEAVTALIMRFIREVNMYFTSEINRNWVRNLVIEAIEVKKPDLIIAHSLGSVVAYEALWGSSCNVETLLTVGSPLALRGGIFDRVIPPPIDGLGKKPDCVGQWLNVADKGDIIAVPRTLSRSYSGITVDRETNIGLFAFHGLNKYLRSADVAQMIRPDDPAGRSES